MTFRGVLLDFSGTLFRLEITEDWHPTDGGAPVDVNRQEEVLRLMTAPAEPTVALPEALRADWASRDLDPVIHRRVNIAALRAAGLHEPGLAEVFYQRLIEPRAWQPYPDTEAALRRLRAAGIPVAVVSNIAWDIRRVFARYELADLVDEFVLSYLEGSVKPDPAIFQLACDRLAVSPAEALMIGDSAEADGGAEKIGATVALVPPLPTSQRPDGLLRTLAAHGIA